MNFSSNLWFLLSVCIQRFVHLCLSLSLSHVLPQGPKAAPLELLKIPEAEEVELKLSTRAEQICKLSYTPHSLSFERSNISLKIVQHTIGNKSVTVHIEQSHFTLPQRSPAKGVWQKKRRKSTEASEEATKK